MREFWRRVVHALETDQPVELVSILASGGSTPRGAGAMMAVFADGASAGTVGGGNWMWRMQPGVLTDELAARLHEMNDFYERTPS